MSAYRFCRTDDIGLLVDALNRCWAPHFPDEPLTTPESFKRSIRDVQVWCSSCMVAFAGPDPIGVLIGAKRPAATLVHRIAVHPDYRRQGHARHMLTSLASKLAILGPPRIVAEVPATLSAACRLFAACGYDIAATLTDYVCAHEPLAHRDRGDVSGFVIPVTVDDLAANGLLEDSQPPASTSTRAAHPTVCWERSVETLVARRNEMAGLAVASDERIEAYVLYSTSAGSIGIGALCSLVDDGGARLAHLLAHLRARAAGSVRFPRVHPSELAEDWLQVHGFSPARAHHLYAATPRADG